MEYRPLKITVISAEGIKDMNMFSKQDVYAIVSLKGYKQSKQKTPVDKDCGTKPKWNHPMEFIVDEPYLTKPGLSLVFKIKAESTLRKDKKIGTVTVSIHELFKEGSHTEKRNAEYQVMTESGQSKGTFKFSYCFGEKLPPKEEKNKQSSAPLMPSHSDKQHMGEPMTAYPPPGAAPYPGMGQPPPPHYAPPPQAAYAGYPPQPSGYGYQPPPPGYGYPPAPGYGYPQGPPAGYAAYPAQKPKKKMGGMGGLGMGLGAGLLGGLLLGEVASDIGDAAAYSEGYGDAMGDMGDF